ncbi:MAG TPA: DUF6456 domain-containing protein [Allosphingosinicella sp.]
MLKEMPLPRDGAERESARRSGRKGGRRKRPARTVTVNLTESPLGWLRSRGLVTARQFDAGETLRADWERGQLAPSVTMRWDASRASAGAGPLEPKDLTAAQLGARRRFREAVAAVGPGLADILWRTVCAGEGMRDAEQALGWPARSGRLVLALALDRLADHYRLR